MIENDTLYYIPLITYLLGIIGGLVYWIYALLKNKIENPLLKMFGWFLYPIFGIFSMFLGVSFLFGFILTTPYWIVIGIKKLI